MPNRRNSVKSKGTKPEGSKMAFKFEPDERVLCYEPDASKAKVLYDAKVCPTLPITIKSKNCAFNLPLFCFSR